MSYPGKRALDLAGAALGLLLAGPVLALAALAIRLEGGGHFIYRQRRVGRDGVPFDLYKLRTMVTGAETMGSGLIVDAGDERITTAATASSGDATASIAPAISTSSARLRRECR